MDHHDFKASETKSNAGHTCSPKKQSLLEKASSLADPREVSADANVEIQKQRHGSNLEICCFKAEKFPGIERNDSISSSGCMKESGSYLRPPLIVSTVRHCNGVGSNESLKNNSEASECSAEEVTTFKKISMKGDVDLENGQPCDKDLHAGTKGRWLSTGENGLRSGMRAVFPDKQGKTESSSSNSSHIILPASSNDSCQDISWDIQSSKLSKIYAMENSTCTDLRNDLEEPAFGSSQPGMAICYPQNMLEKASPHTVQVSETLSIRTRKSENGDISKSDLFKMANEKVDVSGKHGDAFDVDATVARKMEQDFEASGSSSSAEWRNSEMLRRSCVDSVDSSRKSYLTETGSVIQQCKGQEPLSNMGTKVIHEVNGGLLGQELSCETTKSVGLSSCGHHSKIDLNEDVLEHDMEYLGQSGKKTVPDFLAGVSKPKPVMAKPGIPLDFLAPKVNKEGKFGGWRGSTETSAFHPTSITKSCIENKTMSMRCENDSEMHSVVKKIDLNLAATGADFDEELGQDKPAVTELRFPSNMELGSLQARRLDIDLNYVSGNEDDCQQSPLTASLPRQSLRDFDLNDNPTSVDISSVACQPSQGNQALRKMGSDYPLVSSVENSKHQDLRSFKSPYSADLCSMPGFIPGHVQPFLVAAPNMLPSNEQLQRVAFLHQPIPYAQPPHNAFQVDPKDGVSSTVGAHALLPYVVDPHATNIMSQMLGPGGVSAFPSHVFPVHHGSSTDNVTILRPNPDPSNGVNALENVSRGANGSQLCMPSGNSTVDEQKRSFKRVAVPTTGMKRREPEGGWNSPQFSFRKMTSWR